LGGDFSKKSRVYWLREIFLGNLISEGGTI